MLESHGGATASFAFGMKAGSPRPGAITEEVLERVFVTGLVARALAGTRGAPVKAWIMLVAIATLVFGAGHPARLSPNTGDRGSVRHPPETRS